MLTKYATAILLLLFSSTACAQEKAAGPAPSSQRSSVTGQSGDSSASAVSPDAAMLRYPDVSGSHIVFVYANDLWMVPSTGGQAVPLASPPGPEAFPKFSNDGQTIAFVGNYEGDRDLYTVPSNGGVPVRVTHHPANESLCGWTPGGELLFFSNAVAGLGRQQQLATVSAEGGLPSLLPVPYGANGAISADGKKLAYTPHSRDHRTWKRYRGGMATDIWVFDLQDHTSKQITDWEGTDSQPMWQGDTLYYLSDAGPEHRLNIWRCESDGGNRKQVTEFKDYDVKWPSHGPGATGQGEIVLENGGRLLLLDLAKGASREVKVTIPGDRPKLSAHRVEVGKFIFSADISSTGKRAVVEARGDIWTLPAKKGSPRNLTRTAGVAERDPSWSPDGQWLAYLSDETGEYEMYITQSDGKGETKQLTSDGTTYRYSPTWSPDSKQITFTDKAGNLFLHTVEGGETILVDTDPYSGQLRVSWAHDSGWLAYAKSQNMMLSAVWLYDVRTGEKHQVTAGLFNDTWPTFDREGDYLYLASNRNFTSPTYADVDGTFIYADTDTLMVVPLRDDVGSPFAPKSDEEKWGDDEDEEDVDDAKDAKDDDQGDKDDTDDKDDSEGEGENGDEEDSDDDDSKDKDKKKDIEPLEIDLAGLEHRAILIPVKKGSFSNLAVNDKNQLLYTRGAPRGSGGDPSIKLLDVKKFAEDDAKGDGKGKDKEKEKTVLEGVGSFAISADGKSILAFKDRKLAIVKAAADQKFDKPIDTGSMSATIDPPAEWRQMFVEAWRVQRDFFYDPNMHGVDWNAMRVRYLRMIDDCTSREDVTFVIGELISELNVGHAYARGGGDLESQPSVSVGMLGADFELDGGAFRISRVIEGAAWDVDARGPLSQPGVDIKQGDYLLAVNGVPVDVTKDPWAAFVGLANQVVTVTVSEKPTLDDEARDVVIKTLSGEGNLRYRAWVEHNRAYVEEKSGGKVGYIHVPDTGRNGQNELFRQFFGQVGKEALIIDDRWNGGGQIPNRFIELLNRPRSNYWAVRDGKDWAWPYDSHQGPKCMLINGLAGSGGDCFPYYFRQSGIGKLIGMRTWGGLVGISGNPTLIDSGRITSPTFGFYETDGTWGVEGHGVDPDIEVIDDPALMVNGGDPQLDKAIAHMQEEIKSNGYHPPARPAYPDRSGMGILEGDK